MVLVSLLLISMVAASAYAQPSSPSLITHADIRDAILTLVGATREQTDKLLRHEMRERQLGDALTRTLSYIDARSRSQDKNIENLSVVIARMDNRIRKTEEMIQQKDERERIQLQKLMDHTVAIRATLENSANKSDSSASPKSQSSSSSNDGELGKKLIQLRKKVDNLDETIQNRLAIVANEVKIVGEKLDTRSDKLEGMQQSTMESLDKSQNSEAEKLRAASVNLVAAESKWRQFFNNANSIVDQFNTGVARITDNAAQLENERDTAAILVSIEKLQSTLDSGVKTATSGESSQNMTEMMSQSLASINRIENAVNDELRPWLTAIETSMNETREELPMKFKTSIDSLHQLSFGAVSNVSSHIDSRIAIFEAKMADSQLLIQHQVEESAQMAETLAERVDKSYEGLAKEINGLHKVEQVLLETADGVLDTKRRLEFAVQQILLELGSSIRQQTGDLNTTLNRKVEDVTFSVLANQSTALTNMTTKLEAELGQVWRQIGVLYQSASVSQEMLSRVEQQTTQHVGGSLEALSSMDKRVGEVTDRVNEVDDHLNYLLGRLSLVVQEFNQVRSGLGEALEAMRLGMPSLESSTSSSSIDASDTNDIPRKEQLDTHNEGENDQYE